MGIMDCGVRRVPCIALCWMIFASPAIAGAQTEAMQRVPVGAREVAPSVGGCEGGDHGDATTASRE